MKKYILPLLLFPMLGMMSCLDDLSAYDPQVKEEVDVDDINDESDNNDEDEELPEGKLVPGLHLVKIKVTEPDGQEVERRFKYFMPISLDESRPVSLIFEFHGSWSFDAGVKPDDPIGGISLSNALIQHANKENCVIVFPAGTAEFQADGSGAVNWQNSERHLPFFDAMIEYFRGRTPSVDMNRVYSTGQSSGAIFSFVLAFYRSEVVAAITPRAGQMSLADQTEMPDRAVPVRLFAGMIDDTVNFNAAVNNTSTWAERIGGYFASDSTYVPSQFEIEGYRMVDVISWTGGNADYQIYALQEEGHGISMPLCLPYMWEFMDSHPLDAASNSIFVTCSIKEIDAMCGQPVEFDLKYTSGATVEISDPKGWNLKRDGDHISMRAPVDFFGSISRSGNITIKATLNGASKTIQIPYKLQAPKTYFEVGDVYYNEDFKPVGVVFWVNDNNIREAKIVSFQEVTTQGSYYNINFGNFGTTFVTPDENDGEANTAAHMKERDDKGLTKSLTATNSGLVWAATYAYNGTDNWYLPAINELKALGENIETVEKAITDNGGQVFFRTGKAQSYLSSTVELKDGSKYFHTYCIFNNTAGGQAGVNTSYYYARAVRKVTK